MNPARRNARRRDGCRVQNTGEEISGKTSGAGPKFDKAAGAVPITWRNTPAKDRDTANRWGLKIPQPMSAGPSLKPGGDGYLDGDKTARNEKYASNGIGGEKGGAGGNERHTDETGKKAQWESRLE